MSETLTKDLRRIITEYGYKATHETLEKIMSEEWRYLVSVCNELSVDNEVSGSDPFRITVDISESADMSEVQTSDAKRDKKYLSREEEKERKKQHDMKVKAKREENEAQNVRSEDLLTTEKVSDWLSKGWTYWKIAEETGCKDSYVSSYVKINNLKK